MTMGVREPKRSPRLTRAAERRLKAVTLREAGASYQQIGDHLNVTKQRAHQLVEEACQEMEEKTKETAAAVIQLELQRLDRMVLSIYPKAKAGDLYSIDRMLKLSERRTKMLGIDPPQKVAPTDPTGEKEFDFSGMTDAELEQRFNDLRGKK